MRQKPVSIPIFVHIPRTAGTAFRALVTRVYGAGAARVLETGRVFRATEQYELTPGLMASFADPTPLRSMTPTDVEATTAWHGHWPWGLHEWIKQPCRYVVILRHPATRYLSAWRYTRLHPEEPNAVMCAAARSTDDPIEAHMRMGQVNTFLDNPTTRLLAGLHPWRPIPKYQQLENNHYRLAEARLRESVVGCFERMEETVAHFAATLDWPSNAALEHVNELPEEKPALTKAALSDLLVLERYDLLLYAAALSIFEQQLAHGSAACQSN